MQLFTLLVTTMLCALANAHYFEEQFKEDWEQKWVQSEHKSDLGKCVLSAGSFYGDPEKDKGLKTSEDAKFYGISSKFDEFSNEGKNLVIQFSVKHEQGIDCGGGYVKVFPCNFDQKKMHGETPYNIMFGPDICGQTKKVHVILSHKGTNYLVKKDIKAMDDIFTHLYTLILKPENTYEVLIDNKNVESGSLEEDWDILPPKTIKDPEAKKPVDWVDDAKLDDREEQKPEDWDKPEHIPDPDATQPEDWDDEMDGEWEPPMIDNPEFKGDWRPRQIDNPDYKGPWVHPEIDNPEYQPEPNLYSFKSFCGIGFDLWQVKSGTIFDNIIITDDIDAAKTHAKELWEVTSKEEKKMKNEQEEKAKEEKVNEKEEDGEEDDDEDDDLDEDENAVDNEEDLEEDGHDEL